MIVGQGTLGLKLLEAIEDLELLIVPLGSGLLAGTGLVIKQQRPNIKNYRRAGISLRTFHSRNIHRWQNTYARWQGSLMFAPHKK